jgi:hypothetical protein
MFFNQDSTVVLKAKLANAVAVSQLKISVTYRDNTGDYHQDVVMTTNGTTVITLLTAPIGGVVNIVELIKICNPDTQANTVEILANDDMVFTCTVGAGQSAILSELGTSNGLGFTPANADLSNLTVTGKSVVSNLPMPSNSYVNLTLLASGSTYTAPADGYVQLSKNATAANQTVWLYHAEQNQELMSSFAIVPTAQDAVDVWLPVASGHTFKVSYTLGGTTQRFVFVYARGEV